MTLTKSVAKVLGPLLAIAMALAAFAAVSVSAPGVADAAAKPKVKIKTKGPYKKDQRIKVKVSGFPANASLGIGICRAKVDPNGPGDCGPSKLGRSVLATANKKGKATVWLKVPKGKLGSANLPKVKCSNKKKQRCSVHASTITAPSIWKESKRLKYA